MPKKLDSGIDYVSVVLTLIPPVLGYDQIIAAICGLIKQYCISVKLYHISHEDTHPHQNKQTERQTDRL